MDHLKSSIALLPPSTWVQAFFLAAAGGILALHVLPRDVRGELIDYGARRANNGHQLNGKSSGKSRSVLALATSLMSSAQVPHSWFWHFYALSVFSSAFWAWQYARRGSFLASLAEAQARSGGPSVGMGHILLAWLMMVSQGTRRLYECFFVLKPGRTPMLLAHWILALAYYAAINVAVWIEGSGAILDSWTSQHHLALTFTSRDIAAMVVFVAAWLTQNQCHRHLASLKKYTLPSEGAFGYLVCPHYTCECVIYLAIALMVAPAGSFFNTSVLSGAVFVVVNLGATAQGTKQWYAQKFGADKIAARWAMIPFVF
ncbi:hypothetical protein DCS_01244 [Drechmeria coniospora]|uniref:Polyprenal reductase n=1 Tax=Drechmeria coniospora TaxID=98403 RepID=A0A151GSR2_DRECN|nr:hypothetical protein DCS_01244 [Drechmeria coniospora]KYK60110.1 hypothetical protein DCS_01244 [Drechmeria coniospora]ODA80051.1 hypothetical protein RJ55_03009 [Drechmeria coniospora]